MTEASPQAVRVVPVEPTPEILAAMRDAFVERTSLGALHAYRAMLAASPALAATSGGGEADLTPGEAEQLFEDAFNEGWRDRESKPSPMIDSRGAMRRAWLDSNAREAAADAIVALSTPPSAPAGGGEAGRQAIWNVVHEVWQLLDDAETGPDGVTVVEQSRLQSVSEAMDALEALVPDSEGPFWGGFPVNYFWGLK